MNRQEEAILKILNKHKSGVLDDAQAAQALQELKYTNLEFACLDNDRGARQGFPEVVYCSGKTAEQCAVIVAELCKNSDIVMATRADAATFQAIKEKVSDARYYEKARIVAVERRKLPKDGQRFIAVITAGTSDIPVAMEAGVTAELMGNEVRYIFDVGVAGIHRLFSQLDVLRQANVLIVAAGMEGALASVVGGLVEKPVIALPTSVGYGASFGGLAALLGMLNSCSAGVAVVNIDNGFGAGRLASVINHMR